MSPDDDMPINPYPGLRPFHADETHLFFGRDTQTAELLRRLQRSRFLAIVGTSGSGKSSLVRAGLLQGLYGGLLAGGSQWRVVDLRPGTQPLGNLAAALDRPGALRDEGISAEDSFTDATLRRSALGLVQAVREAQLAPRERVLVLVDQFEELFRSTDGKAGQHVDDDAAAFVQLLLAAAQQQALPIYVALTMRSDFLGECARFRDLPEAISDGQYLIPRLTRDQLREAITGPAAVQGVALSDRLVDRLLNDLGGNPDQLPILQHALMRTWDLWVLDPARAPTLDLPDYERIGGMAQALSRHADEVLASLGEGPAGAAVKPRRIAECLFKALATIGPGGQEVRRFASVQSVADIAGASVDAVIAVVEAFRAPGNSFLMPPVGEPLGAATDLDISHESLIRNWGTVRGWLAEETDSQRIYERVSSTAALHAQGQAGLLPGPDLSRALAWRARQRPTPAWARRYEGDFAQAMDFIDDSQVQASADERISAGRRRTVTAAFVLSMVVALVLSLSWVAEESWRRLDLQASSAEAMHRIDHAGRLAKVYAARRDAVDADTCADLAQQLDIDLDRPGEETDMDWGPPAHSVRPVYDSLCDKQASSEAAAHWFDPFFVFTRTLASGEIGEAASQAAELDDYLRIPAQVLLDAKVAVQSSRLGDERLALALRQESLVGVMAEVHAGYRETGELDAGKCDEIRTVISGEPGWAHLREIADWLCEAETKSRAGYFQVSGLMLDGNVEEAERVMDRQTLETGLLEPARSLRQALVDLQSARERADLVRLSERSGLPAEGVRPASRGATFRHPVHIRIERGLQSSGPTLHPGETWLLGAYRRLSTDAGYRQSMVRGHEWSDVPENVPLIYVEMVQRAAEHESAGLVRVADYARDYGASLLILLSWPIWWAWRQWQHRRGSQIAERPAAWRRALANVFDSGIAVAAFFAVGFTATEALAIWAEAPRWLLDLGPVTLALAAGWGYLLFCDALPLRHQRSLGKIAFHLRPVRDVVGGTGGRMTLSVAARRGAPIAAVLPLLTLVAVVGFLSSEGVQWLKAYLAFALLILYWLPMALRRDGRSWGDRWSGTRVIDADSDASPRVDAPPRYLETLCAPPG